jgi:YD repeat-containing protein
MMGKRLGLLVALFLMCVVYVLAWISAATASGSEVDTTSGQVSPVLSSAGETGPSLAGGVLGGPLVIAGGLGLASADARYAEEARLDSPEAFQARQESEHAFEGISPTAAQVVAGEAFPVLVDEPAGGLPRLPQGQSWGHVLGVYAAQVSLSEGQHGVAESLVPLALEEAPGRFAPLELGLTEAEGSFVPRRAVVPTRVGQNLSEGVSLPDLEVSLTPLEASGSTAASAANGTLDGETVFYGASSMGANTDALARATSSGVELLGMLRSPGPQTLRYRVGLPEGASLVQTGEGQGPVQIVRAGQTLATIPEPAAVDAEGTPVGVSTSVRGDVLELKVDDEAGKVRLPVLVDPEITDSELVASGNETSNWEFNAEPVGDFKGVTGASYRETQGTGEYAANNWAAWAYQTKGISKIYEVKTKTGPANNKEANIASYLELADSGVEESRTELSTELHEPEYAEKSANVCPPNAAKEQSCLPGEGHEKNTVLFEQAATASPKGHYNFSDRLDEGIVSISEPAGTHSTAEFNKSSSEIEVEVEKEGKKVKEKRINALDGSGVWLSKYDGALELIAKDKGIGVDDTKFEYESAPGKWELVSGSAEHNYRSEKHCQGVQCYVEHKEWWLLESKLPNGEDKVRYRAEEAMEGTESPASEDEATIKVDTTKPDELYLAGLPAGNELSERTYELTAYATDGEGSTVASSGIESIALYVDGKSIEKVSKEESSDACSVPKGECAAHAKYQLKGSELGAGHHSIEIVAKDRAGNEAREYEPVTIRHSTPVALGPGSIDLQSGDFALSATDVNMGSGLTVSRSYSSRDLTQGAEGPLGPEWTMSLGPSESLVEIIDGSMVLTDANGEQTIFAEVEPKTVPATYEAPVGDSNLKLTLEENKETKQKVAYYLENTALHTKDKFTLPSGDTKTWVPSIGEGAVSATATFAYAYEVLEPEAGKKLVVPHEELAPHPGVSCAPMKAGCRALKFKYATETTASGENESEWGAYKDRLEKIYLEAYNPASKEMVKEPGVAVAEYAYDKQGRLRAEWDPRVSPALKTTYGYDAEGHVTALTPPGQESWAFTYAAIPGDSGTGRLIRVTQAPGSAGLWKGEAVADTEVPAISGGTPILGTSLSASLGKWTGSPVVYSYQWERCNGAGGKCEPIAGATNADYTPTAADEGHTLVVRVGAANGDGTVTAVSAASAGVAAAHKYSLESGAPRSVVAGPDGKLWFTDQVLNEIGRITTSGAELVQYSLPSGSLPHGITTDPEKASRLWFTDYGTSKIGHISTSGTELKETELPKESKPYAITPGPEGEAALWFTDEGTGKIGRITTGGEVKEYALPAGSKPRGIVAGPNKQAVLWFAEAGTHKIGRISTSGTELKEYSLASYGAAEGPSAITVGPDGQLWFPFCLTLCEIVEVGKTSTTGAVTVYSSDVFVGSQGTEGSTGITTGPDGNVWLTTFGGDVASINSSGVLQARYGVGSKPMGITGGPGNEGALWLVDYSNKAIDRVATTAEDQTGTPQPGTTIEYGVPLEGSGAPAQMGRNETSHMHEPVKWGQSEGEYPVEATAILPPDSPQAWPAASYKRATTYYLDSKGRTVNVAAPSKSTYGAIATTEYNEFNDVTRTLTSGNRERALQAGCESQEKCKSAEESKLLDTESTYNGEGAKEGEVQEPGTQLIETAGPEHMVKYTAGEEQYEPGEKPKEALARSYTRNYYNEGAPAENPRTHRKEVYDLLTKSQNYAELASPTNKERVDVKTTTDSYAGQNDLGWLLRTPTSTTVNPGSLKTTTTTVYEENAAKESNGDVVETRGAGAESTLTYASRFGEAGTEPGKLKSPFGLAIDSKGNLWSVDEGNSRIQEFGPEGKYLASFGKLGTEAGELKEPKGLAIEPNGDLWVAEAGNNRVQKFAPEGKSLLIAGKSGTGNGELKSPTALALDKSGDIWVADTGNNRIQEFAPEGKYLASFGKAGSGYGELKEPKGIAIDAKGNIWVADTGNNRIEEFEPNGKLLSHFGSQGTGAGQLKTPFGLAFDASGHLWVADEGNNRIQEFSTSGVFISQAGWSGKEPGQLSAPKALAFTAGGEAWVSDASNNRLEQFSKGANARDQKIVYYSSEANTEGFAGCGKHPEWEGLPCQTQPTKQPELAGLPKLPITTTTYNLYDEPETIEESFVHLGAEKHEETTIRTKKNTYDEAGRLTLSETTSSSAEEKALPSLKDKYNSESGLLETQTATVKGEEKTITSKYNALGQMTEYTDADGAKSTFKYAGPEGDYLLEEAKDGSAEGAGKQTYFYDETTKLMTKLTDSAAGTFTASYNTEGQLQNEVYPNGMCANYAYNQVGEPTRVEYIKTTNCAEEKPAVWYYDERTPSVRGEMMSQASSLASDSYGYDQAGRITEAQETPSGEGCTMRLYAYDEESDRISQATAKPNSKSECTSEGAIVQAHNYDEAGRLTDEGITYDAFGNITKLPEADAEKHALTSSFYVTNAVASQEQNSVKNEYELDPLGRILQTTTGTTHTISHYDAPGETVAWTCAAATGTEACEKEKWTRNIPGIDGTLAATQSSGSEPVLQLHDLQGDVVATAALSPSETKLLSTYNSTEFGVPNKEKEPPTFAWLGAKDISKSLASGVITYGATSYVPQTGMALQSEQIEPIGEGGSGAGTPYISTVEPWVWQAAAASAAQAPGREAAQQHEAEEAAARAAGSEGVDPTAAISLSGKLTKWLARALATGAPIISRLISKYGDAIGALIAAGLEVAAGESVKGLNRCYEAYQAAGGSKEYSCKVVYHYLALPGPPYQFPEELAFENCYSYRRYKREKESCYSTYTIGLKNLV